MILAGVARSYRTPTGEVQALREVSATLPRAEVSAIVGPSGSGKSSLLRLIAGMDRPTHGTVLVEGRDVGSATARERRRLRRDLVGYVFQRPSANFFSDLTVGEHLRLAAGPGPDPATLATILDALGLAHRADHLPSELSGGEQQRAAFAQALASGARTVVADEPTAELDTASAELVLERLRALAADGVTFVIATHDPGVIAAAGHRLELEHGRVRDAPVPRAPGDPSALLFQDVRDPVRWPDDLPPWVSLPNAPVLQLEGVTKTYGRGDEAVHALRHIDFTAASGEIVELVGRSGSGKTSLLNVAVGWQRADAGTVTAPGGAAPTWADVAVLPQRLGLMDELTVGENVEYPARLAGRLEERRALVQDLLEVLGLSLLRNRHPKETSLGEQQRTALARALVLGPRLLVADEPTAHQDARWAQTMFSLLGDAAAVTGSCCVIATHDSSFTAHVDRTVAMADGRIVDGI